MTASAPELARRLADALEAANVPHAIGGALALGVWGVPRATNDVDLDIFVEPDDLPAVLPVLRSAGCAFSDDAVLNSARDRGDFNMQLDGMRIDVFVTCVPYYESVQRRVRKGPLEGRPASYLSPEDLTVFKFLFFRTKDLLDVERLVAFQGPDLDRAYVRKWLVDLVGEGDERLARWDQLLADVDAGSSR